MSKFIVNLEKNVIEKFYLPKINQGHVKNYEVVDQYAVATAVNENIILDETDVYVTVETRGDISCGQMIVDWNNVLQMRPNVKLVLRIDAEKMANEILKIFAS